MATLDDVRRICAELAGVVEGGGTFSFGVSAKGKVAGFVWSWKERVDPKKSRIENRNVLAIVVPGLGAKEVLVAGNPPWSVLDSHYAGYPAVLVRLAAIDVNELEDLLIGAWRCKMPNALLRETDRSSARRSSGRTTDRGSDSGL